MKIIEKKSKVDGGELTLCLIPLENAIIAFLSEGDIKLGTLAYASPGAYLHSPMASAVLIGGKFQVLSRTLAERLVRIFNKISLVSVNIKIPEPKGLKEAVKMLKEVI